MIMSWRTEKCWVWKRFYLGMKTCKMFLFQQQQEFYYYFFFNKKYFSDFCPSFSKKANEREDLFELILLPIKKISLIAFFPVFPCDNTKFTLNINKYWLFQNIYKASVIKLFWRHFIVLFWKYWKFCWCCLLAASYFAFRSQLKLIPNSILNRHSVLIEHFYFYFSWRSLIGSSDNLFVQ